MDKIKIGIAGSGAMAQARLAVFGQERKVKPTALYSANASKAKQDLCKTYGLGFYNDYEEFLAQIDAVVICLPNYIHSSLAYAALKAGRHVLVEYPMCTDINEIDKLKRAASEAGVVLMTGNTIIHEAMFKYLMTHKAKLGKILSASSRVALYDSGIAGAWYMDEKLRGSIFSAFHYHHIEYYRHLLGEVESAHAYDESIAGLSAGGTLLLRHKMNRTSTIQWYLSSAGNGLPRGMWINGTEASVSIISCGEDESLVIWDQGTEGRTEKIKDSWGVPESCNDFIAAINGSLDYESRLESDIKTLKTGLSAL
jgi:predicted dehydrogenase